MGRRDPISWFSISKVVVQRMRDSFVGGHTSTSVHNRYHQSAVQSCVEFSRPSFGQSAKIQGTNLEQVSKSLSRRDVFPAEQTMNFVPPKRGVGKVAAHIADRWFPLLTIFLVGHFLVGEMSSLGAA